jgi:uncharacterized membrane protein
MMWGYGFGWGWFIMMFGGVLGIAVLVVLVRALIRILSMFRDKKNRSSG